MEGSKAELARKLAEAEARLQTRSVTAADPPLELQRAITAALAERDGTIIITSASLPRCSVRTRAFLVCELRMRLLAAEAHAALATLRNEISRSGDAGSRLTDQDSVGELASLRSQLDSLRAQSAQDDAYKLQTMQYLRKYEAELQRKEKQLSELRQQLQLGNPSATSTDSSR